ncbi:uncharacterized protein LY89DRAFT_192295 [Mollisia scopiformis]|uniref:Nephrocystin 3-like N-terminal domain-containing protein n=1 Tax=Mollisia scopiformis TaxID=149040 RepID=A0A194WYT9_MOLSC|nr:uncharacterized protein LY89DRAFT_192295 [Mollisia scopiformis]KUJ12762.1 hypothetical protein LY89DRAFT_192295 [Mollisia scopiformis]
MATTTLVRRESDLLLRDARRLVEEAREASTKLQGQNLRQGHSVHNFQASGQARVDIGDHFEYNISIRPAPEGENGPTRKEVLDWIECIDFTGYYRDHLERLYDKMGVGLLTSESFLDWCKGRTNWLWCYGMPGAGKTAFTTIIIRHILETQKTQPKIGLAYLYCIYSDDQSALKFLGALLRQLAGQSEQISPELLSLYKDHNSGSSPTRPLLEGYEKALGLELSRFESVYIIVDALDECRNDDENESHQATRIRILQTLASFGNKIQLLFTSRDERPVTAPPLTSLAIMKVSATDGDIKLYVEGRIAKKASLQACTTKEPLLATRIKRIVVERAAGMFLPAKLHMDILGDAADASLTPYGVAVALQTLPSFRNKSRAQASEAYQEAYQTILKNIWDQSHADLARKVLSWVVFAEKVSTLTISIVQRAISIDALRTASENIERNAALDDEDQLSELEDEDDISFTSPQSNEIAEEVLLSVCRGLVTVDNSSGRIRLVHYTAESYFASEVVQRRFFPKAQEDLAEACIACLSSDDAYEHPLYKYSSRHWGHHARHAESQLQQKIEYLIQDTRVSRDCSRSILHALPPSWLPSKRSSLKHPLKPLHLAAYFDLKLTAMQLLANGVQIDCQDSREWNAMKWAVVGESEELVTLLYERQPSLLCNEIVFWAINSRPRETIFSSLTLSGRSKVSLGNILTVKSSQSFATTLPKTVIPNSSPTVVQFLLNNVHDIDASREVDGRTLLSLVAENWQWDYVRTLLDRGANVNLKDKKQMTPLLWALQSPRQRTTIASLTVCDRALLSIGDITNVNPSLKINISDNSISEKHIESNIRRLIGQDLEAMDWTKRTALSLAAEGRFHTIVEALLTQGANSNTSDANGMTPLHYACCLPCFQTVTIQSLTCLDRANVRLGATKIPELSVVKMHQIINKPIERSVRLLLTHEASRTARNAFGETPLSLAVSEQLESYAELLRNHGTQDEQQDSTKRGNQQMKDYARLLSAMLDRRGQFDIHSVTTADRSNLLVYATSTISSLTTTNRSRVVLIDRPRLSSVTAMDRSTLIIHASAFITSLFTDNRSRVFLKGQSNVSSANGMGRSFLRIGANTQITEIQASENCKVLTEDQSQSTTVLGMDTSKLWFQGQTGISSIEMSGNCSIHTKGTSEVTNILVCQNSRLFLEAKSQVAKIQTQGRGRVWTTGSCQLALVDGTDSSALILDGETKIAQIEMSVRCSMKIMGRSEVSKMIGHDSSALVLDGNTQIAKVEMFGRCSVMITGRSKVSRVTGCDNGNLFVVGDAKIGEITVPAEFKVRLYGLNPQVPVNVGTINIQVDETYEGSDADLQAAGEKMRQRLSEAEEIVEEASQHEEVGDVEEQPFSLEKELQEDPEYAKLQERMRKLEEVVKEDEEDEDADDEEVEVRSVFHVEELPEFAEFEKEMMQMSDENGHQSQWWDLH